MNSRSAGRGGTQCSLHTACPVNQPTKPSPGLAWMGCCSRSSSRRGGNLWTPASFRMVPCTGVVVVRLLIVGTILRCLLMFPVSFNSDSCNPFYIPRYCFLVILLQTMDCFRFSLCVGKQLVKLIKKSTAHTIKQGEECQLTMLANRPSVSGIGSFLYLHRKGPVLDRRGQCNELLNVMIVS